MLVKLIKKLHIGLKKSKNKKGKIPKNKINNIKKFNIFFSVALRSLYIEIFGEICPYNIHVNNHIE